MQKKVKDHIKGLGGQAFVAYNQNGDAVDVHIVESGKKYRNAKGRKVPVNSHLTDYLKSEIKQEAIMLVDELISTASHERSEPAHYPHGWVDNYGQNDWEVWTTYIKDKENTVWEATLHIANSADGEKILYGIHPIKMVEGTVKHSTTSTKVTGTSRETGSSPVNNSIPQNSDLSTESAKNKEG